MAYKIIVQDGIVTYSSADPTTTDLNVSVEGNLQVNDVITIGNPALFSNEGTISTTTGSNLLLTTGGSSIVSLGTLVGGSGYANGIYLNVSLTGGHGTSATGNITVSGGAVTAVQINNNGNGYAIGDTLSATPASSWSSTGSGFSIKVTDILNSDLKIQPSGDIYLGNALWPRTTPVVGQYLGASAQNVLSYIPAVLATSTDTLTTAQLATNYPNAIPGQVVVGPNIVYECIDALGLSTSWRVASGGVKRTGDTMTGLLILSGNPTTALGAATKQYVDNIANITTVPWTGVTGKPTTIAGYGITDAYTKDEVNFYDYLNFPPFAGVLKENQVPISSTFGMSQTTWGSSSFGFIDNTGKSVIFFSTDTPVGDNHIYRAYRFSDADPYIYDSNPIELTFLNPGEKVLRIINMGTNFAILGLSTVTLPESITRHVAVWTGGSSNWQDWIFAYTVSSLVNPSGARTNLFLMSTNSGDRILQYYLPTNQLTAELRVYDSSLTLLRSQQIYDYASDVTNVDQTGAGRHTVSQLTLLNYAAYGVANPFTWNSFTETFYAVNNSYFTYKTAANATIGQGISVSLSWAIPLEWIENGTGLNYNLIPAKGSGYRYHQLPDTTWDTNDGGCAQGWGGSGYCTSVVTDAYSGNMNVLIKSSFSNIDVAIYKRLPYDSGYIYQTFGSNNNSKLILNATYNAPDGSPWSKMFRSYWLSIIDDNVRVQATSTRYGTMNVQTTMDTNSFNTVATSNDTIILNSSDAILNVSNTDPAPVRANYFAGAFGVVVVGGFPTYYHTAPNSPVYTITASGADRVYTDTGLVMPVLPATIGSVTVTAWQQVVAWNGDLGNPIYWAVIKDPTSLVYMAKNEAGVWSIPGSALFRTQQIAGNTNRGDSSNAISIITFSGQTLVTESGRILFNFNVPIVGNTAYYWGCYYTGDDTEEVGTYTRFQQTTTSPITYPLAASSGGFGYSSYLGYYRTTMPSQATDMCFISSKDLAGSGPDLTENQWFNNTAPRYQLFMTTESATGLVAYSSSYPIFLGGYYSTIPAQSIPLSASSNNYIYATRDPLDRNVINISVSTTLLPSSNTRALLANVVTDTENVVSQELFNVAQHDTVEELENVTIVTKAVNNVLTWDGDSWIAASNNVSKAGDTMSGNLTMAGGATVTGLPAPTASSDAVPKSYVDGYAIVPAGTVAYYMGTTPPSGWLIANGATFSSSTYPALAAALGGTTLPDLRGVFIRGLDLGRGIDTGRTLNTLQGSQVQYHKHMMPWGEAGSGPYGNSYGAGHIGSGTTDMDNYWWFTNDAGADANGNPNPGGEAGAETRPVNVSTVPIIKY